MLLANAFWDLDIGTRLPDARFLDPKTPVWIEKRKEFQYQTLEPDTYEIDGEVFRYPGPGKAVTKTKPCVAELYFCPYGQEISSTIANEAFRSMGLPEDSYEFENTAPAGSRMARPTSNRVYFLTQEGLDAFMALAESGFNPPGMLPQEPGPSS